MTLDPHRAAAARAVRPRQTWWGRFAAIRRLLGGRWELWLIHPNPSIVGLELARHRWVRVVEFDGRDKLQFDDPPVEIDVLARQRDDGSVTWSSADVLWSSVLPSAWRFWLVRRALGGLWERWCGGDPNEQRRWQRRCWIPANFPSAPSFTRVRVDKVEYHPERRR